MDQIDSLTLKKMFLAGTKKLESQKEWINELNVFPVPDGDTGTNMTLTLTAAAKELQKLPQAAGINEIAEKISTGTLRGARGNSGVIMSQLCRGFAKSIEGNESLDRKTIAAAFEKASATAYKAVMKPKEGTILTVAKAAADKAKDLCKKDLSLEDYFEKILAAADDMLQKTPDLLPVLKEAGVVDSGGQGLLIFLEGAVDAFLGKETIFEAEEAEKEEKLPNRTIDTTNIETSDIQFGYCTEFIIELEKAFSEEQENEFKDFLNSIGDSIVCVHMDSIVKVHVHTNHPGQAIEKALNYGQLSSMKIDNMRIEHHEKVIKEADKALAQEKAPEKTEKIQPLKEYGFVTICSGDGIAEIFRGLNVDEVLEGGQTMNPSTDDILEAIARIPAETVFILPNNSNIIMAANQAKDLSEGKHVFVIPTKTICQGINAMINFVPSLSPENNLMVMKEGAEEIKSGEVTYAIRDTSIDFKTIQKGDYMGIADGKLLSVSKDLAQTTLEMIREMTDEETELVTLYYGADITEETAQEIASAAEELLPEADIELSFGGQQIYYFFISVE